MHVSLGLDVSATCTSCTTCTQAATSAVIHFFWAQVASGTYRRPDGEADQKRHAATDFQKCGLMNHCLSHRSSDGPGPSILPRGVPFPFPGNLHVWPRLGRPSVEPPLGGDATRLTLATSIFIRRCNGYAPHHINSYVPVQGHQSSHIERISNENSCLAQAWGLGRRHRWDCDGCYWLLPTRVDDIGESRTPRPRARQYRGRCSTCAVLHCESPARSRQGHIRKISGGDLILFTQ